MTTIKSLCCAVLLASLAAQVSAHQIKAAITTVLFNPRTDNIEIMHRFNLHDAEHAVKELFDKHADILDDEFTQTAFANYVSDRFAMLDNTDMGIPLKFVGYEVDGKHFWVYQETAQPPQLSGLRIRHDSLRDLWPAQVNTLNIEGKGDIKTLTFSDNVTLVEVNLTDATARHNH